MNVDADVKHGRKARPLLPHDDPFYGAPVGFAAVAEGTIIRSREVRIALLGLVPQKISAWQLLYRSTDLNGTPEAAVTTVLLPDGADPDEPRPLLAFQCAIDAVASKCFPSYALQRGARSLGSVPQLELFMIAAALRRGWAVSVADHEGIHGYFGAPREPGYRVLDGIRAALAFAPLGLSRSTPLAMWGYSGGGMATSWAAEMAPSYAPDLDIAGAVMGAPVGDPGETFIRLNGTASAGLPSIVVAAIRHIYPELGRIIREHANLVGRRKLDDVEKMSTVAAVMRYFRDDFGDYVDIPLADLLALPEVMEVFDDLRLGKNIPQCPLFVLQPIHDQIVAADAVDTQVGQYVAGGAHVTYVRDRLSEHLSLMITSTPVVLDWLSDRFEGKPLPAASTKTVLSMALSPSAIRGLIDLTWGAAKVIFGRPLRPFEGVRFAARKDGEPDTARSA